MCLRRLLGEEQFGLGNCGTMRKIGRGGSSQEGTRKTRHTEVVMLNPYLAMSQTESSGPRK